MNASLINLTSLIQKLLEENKKNNQENDLSNASSSNNLLLNSEINNTQNSKNKGIEVNKKNTNTTSNTNYSNNTNNTNNTTTLKKNVTNQIINNSPIKNNNSPLYSNINMNTMSNLKGLNLATKCNREQDENNNISNEHSVVLENKNKTKKKNKNKNYRNEYNKSLNTFDFRKTSIYSLASKKIETTKNTGNKKGKIETSFKKINSKKNKNSKNRSNSRKHMNSKEPADIVEESKIKEENKENFVNKNNKVNKLNGGNNSNSNSNFNQMTHMRKSFQKLRININEGNIKANRKRSRSRSNQNKSLTHCNTKVNLRSKNKPSININFNNVNNTTYNNINKEALMEKLSNLEKSYYILSKSPVLRLKERLFFGRSTLNLRNIQSVSDILKKNETFLKEKIKELEGEIIECDKRINTAFNPSKMAEINFNFILSKDEDEFKNFIWFAENESEKSEYYYYLKLFYLLFNESYENIELKHLVEKLYVALNNKGYKTIKEYLYDIYFKKKENNNIVYNIDKIDNLLKEAEIDQKLNIKFCRFALFTSFLVKEIIKYGNDVKNMVELKIKTKEFIDVINNKLELYKMANTFKKLK